MQYHSYMPNAFNAQSYMTLLNQEFEFRKSKNIQYSLRAFSRDLRISTSKLSQILKGAKLSIGLAGRIATQLPYSDSEREYFLKLVLAQHGRTAEQRSSAKKSLRSLKSKRSFEYRKATEHDVLSKWYYLALIELLDLPAPPTTSKIAETLGIEKNEIENSISFLSQSGYIKKAEGGRHKKSSAFLKFESKAPSSQIRNYHKQYLKKSINAIDTQRMENRKFLTVVMGLSADSLAEAKKELEMFHEHFMQKYSSPTADTIYTFSLQFYRLYSESE